MNTVQEYAWGDIQAIPTILGVEPNGEPQAELWMGAHPKAPSQLPSGQTLDQAIAADPKGHLGPAVNERFGQLPFLFKILAAGKPLSIQSHPSLAQAQAGFERENHAGVALDSPVRTYRDANHKPEMICALTPFVGKCGFQDLDATRRLFARLDDNNLDPVRERLAASGPDADVLADTLAWLLRLPPVDAAKIAAATVAAAEAADDRRGFEAELEWTAKINQHFPNDIGLVVALLLNHVVLRPGEAFFLRAGNLHAYLQGVGVELMANSDNVVRGGLTPKNIDVEELLSVVDCTPIDPPVQVPGGSVHTFDAPVPEFSLTRIELGLETVSFIPTGPEIVLVVEGNASATTSSETLAIRQGGVVFVSPNDGPYTLKGSGLAFRASTP